MEKLLKTVLDYVFSEIPVFKNGIYMNVSADKDEFEIRDVFS